LIHLFPMSKKLWMDAHEELVEEYLEEYPDADWAEAYNRTTEHASERMGDNLADLGDQLRKQLREED